MEQIESIKAREANCRSAGDYVALAVEARALDAELAKDLLAKAEALCQMPADYLGVAEAAAEAGATDYAAGLFEQARDACREPLELAALGASLARTGVDRDKGRAMLEQAAGQATNPAELLSISASARETLGDEALAAALLAQVEATAKGLDDYLVLANTLIGQGAVEAARDLYTKAARHCDDTDATVTYARGLVELFGDLEGARKLLEDAEADCQFPKDFVGLAAGYKALFDDRDKVVELLGQAGEAAMAGLEHLDVGKGYWALLADQANAVAAFEKALPEVTDKAELVELAGYLASAVKAPESARRFFAKAEGKMTAAGERIKLAEAVLRDTGDKGFALEVYGRAADRLTQPNDLMALAANLVDQLGDREKAGEVYRKAFAAMGDLGQYTKLLDAVGSKLADQAFAREILDAAGRVAAGTPELLDLAQRAMATLRDQALVRDLLAKAEGQVTSVGEMRAVVAAVKALFPDDQQWVQTAAEKLARREANQAKYAAFQEREKSATSAIRLIQLADAVMAELEDKAYAQKLLADAEKRLDHEGWDFSKARLLVAGVAGHLGDSEWASRLLREAGERVRGLGNLMLVLEAARSLLPDPSAARALIAELLGAWEQGLADQPHRTAYDYSKLAALKGGLLSDQAGAAAALEQAEALGGDHFVFAELARVAASLGLGDKIAPLLGKAAGQCINATQARQLAERLLATGCDREKVRALYAGLRGVCQGAAERLAWADGVLNVFQDRHWAQEVYQGLAQDPELAAKARHRLRVRVDPYR